MKKNILFWGLSLLTVVATGCSNEEVLNNATEANDPMKALSVSVEELNSSSRIGFDNENNFFWSTGDELAVKTINKKDNEIVSKQNFEIEKGTDKGPGFAEARFSALVNGKFNLSDIAAYPYENVKFAANGNFSFDYPALYDNVKVDTQRPASDAPATTKAGYVNCHAVMAGAISTAKTVKLQHLGGYFLVKVEQMPYAKGCFIFTADKNIAGTFTETEVALKAGKAEFKNTEAVTGTPAKTVKINFTGATVDSPAYFYIPVPTGDYDMVTVALATAQDATPTLSRSKRNVTVTRAEALPLTLASFSGSDK